MSFAVQATYGDISVTVSNDADYDGLVADDMAGVARRECLRFYCELPTDDEPGLTHHEAMMRDYLQEDD